MSRVFTTIRNNMKYAFIIALLLLSTLAKSQSLRTVDSVSIYIDRLGWNSFNIVWNYTPQIALYGDAKRLIEIKDDEKIKRLVNSVGIKEKTVVVHMILSRLFDSANARITASYNYGNDSKIKSVTYSYNGLEWTEDNLQEKRNVSQDEIDKAERYWRKRCHL